jgi:hypothetical protein
MEINKNVQDSVARFGNAKAFEVYFWIAVTVILGGKVCSLYLQLEASLKQCITTLTGGGLYW